MDWELKVFSFQNILRTGLGHGRPRELESQEFQVFGHAYTIWRYIGENRQLVSQGLLDLPRPYVDT